MTTIHREGLMIILVTLLVVSCLLYIDFNVIGSLFWSIVLAVVILIPFVFFVAFFRYPKRQQIPGEGVVTSVADGTVVMIERTYVDEYFHDERIKVSVFMSIFNVHVNFWPISGMVTYSKYHPGKYYMAHLPKASDENEHSTVVVRNADGKEIMYRQVAGLLARRVVNYASEGVACTKAKECGVIKFGSRIDMFLPLDAKIEVEVDDVVKACTTIIAEI